MSNCDKLISESQERMLIVVKPKILIKYLIYLKNDLEYCVIGNVNSSGDFVVKSYQNIIYQNMNTFENVQQDWTPNDSSKSDNDFWELKIDNNLWRHMI